MRTLSVVVALVLCVSHVGSGQVRGLGFVQGKILDEKGAPLGDVACTAVLPRVGDRLGGSSNNKGEWRIVGMAHGEWEFTFEKPGYSKARAKVVLETELSRIPPITVTLRTTP